MNASRIPLVVGTALMIGVFTPAGPLRSEVIRRPRGVRSPQVVKRSASRTKARVEAALRADARLRGSRVFVQSANDGVVVLAGTAKTVSDHLRATGDAARVPGVHRVANEVKTQDVLMVGEESRGERRPPEAERSYGPPDAVRDPGTTSATRARVLADSPTPGLRLVNVDTRDGAVRLFGAVPPARVKAAAEESARKMSGVKHEEVTR